MWGALVQVLTCHQLLPESVKSQHVYNRLCLQLTTLSHVSCAQTIPFIFSHTHTHEKQPTITSLCPICAGMCVVGSVILSSLNTVGAWSVCHAQCETTGNVNLLRKMDGVIWC